MNRQSLLESITHTISDYRIGEILPVTINHVNKWVSQFNSSEQIVILTEIDYLLRKNYISRAKAKSFLNGILTSQEIFGDNPFQVIPYVQFLDIQRKGSSQKDLLKLANEISVSQYGLEINKSVSRSLMYIYLDDCLFSGNTVFYDIKTWLDNVLPNTTIYLIFLACYTSGIRYIQNKLFPIAKQKNIAVKILTFLTFNNLSWQQDKYECLWPSEITEDELVSQFVNIVQENSQNKSYSPRLFRPTAIPQQETLFSSHEARKIVETAFLKKGAYIVSLPRNRQASMRPMGYEYLESLGFGAIFITYRNIANNCPLVLWWGDPNYASSHPFSKWYPLFPRKVNESSNTANLLADF